MGVSLDFKRGLKTLWAESAQGKMPSLEAYNALAVTNPYRNIDPLNEVLAYLALRNTGRLAPPLVPRIVPMPVAELCQLALLWVHAGEIDAASALAYSIPLDFPWMWCRENEYQEEETLASLDLLSRVLKHEQYSCDDFYLQALSKNLSHLEPPQNSTLILDWLRLCQIDPSSSPFPQREGSSLSGRFGCASQSPNLQNLPARGIKCCLTFSGSHTSLGSLVSNAGAIRAFGPQTIPLSHPEGFGIRSITHHDHRWASPSASPEVWFETKARLEGIGIVLDFSFFGLMPSTPLAFSFYVKADSAQIGNEKFKPKTLQRYHGISKPVQFGGGLCIESLAPCKMELIPLAGGGGYWDCEYLAAFEIHPVNAKMSFFIYLV